MYLKKRIVFPELEHDRQEENKRVFPGKPGVEGV
jgi:hypothetical protein